MFWTLRWIDVQTQEDRWLVVEAMTRGAAEGWGLKRGFSIVSMTEAHQSEVSVARKLGLLRQYSPHPRYTCCGQAVGNWQLAMLMICGLATAALHLRSLPWPVQNLL